MVWKANASKCDCSPADLSNNLVIECHADFTVNNYRSCATYEKESEATLVGLCPYNSNDLEYNKLSFNISAKNINLTSLLCDPLNRTGVLCSHCKPGLGPALLNYSYPCLECTRYGWVAYFAATLIPATLFFTVIVVFQIDATSPALSYFVFFSQIVILAFQVSPNLLNETKHYHHVGPTRQLIQMAITFYGFWNLDFFRLTIPPFCVSSDMSMLTVLALEYVVAVYPLLFTALVYTLIELHARGCTVLNVLWRPFHPLFYRFRKYCDIRGSVINAFATFICLSYSKVCSSSVNMIRSHKIYSTAENNFTSKHFLYFNSSITVDDTENIPYFMLGVFMMLVFCALPLVLLAFFHTRLCRRLHKYRFLREVVKVFQKHYKDGSDGSWDCRSFSGFYLALRILFTCATHANSLSAHFFLFFAALLFISQTRPYKQRKYNHLDCFWLAQLIVVTAIIYQYGQKNWLESCAQYHLTFMCTYATFLHDPFSLLHSFEEGVLCLSEYIMHHPLPSLFQKNWNKSFTGPTP